MAGVGGVCLCSCSVELFVGDPMVASEETLEALLKIGLRGLFAFCRTHAGLDATASFAGTAHVEDAIFLAVHSLGH